MSSNNCFFFRNVLVGNRIVFHDSQPSSMQIELKFKAIFARNDLVTTVESFF